MLRLRRYRVFVICAFVAIFLLYHVSRNSQWEDSQPAVYEKINRPHYQKPKTTQDDTDKVDGQSEQPPSYNQHEVDDIYPKQEQEVKIPQLKTTSEVKGGYGLPKVVPTTTSAATTAQKTDSDESSTDKTPAIELPDRVANPGSDNLPGNDGNIKIWHPPKKHQDTVDGTAPAIHWKKPKEWFPVPKESIIPLPTGSPKAMPSIQYKFKEETQAQKEKRESRLAKVKAEAVRAWSGYKQFAWTHDELTPVTKHAKDPFCGWAATLVDSLDTLWIMGLKDEFDDAVKAVKEIDFTTTPYRADIPIFETIIRYLGGLVGAYDVTGGHDGKYRVLLDKALELAEILMSVFDTPNRMPILYYNWQPEFNENPKRAPTSASVAEIGSMGMEFTRLAQLTGEDKYYDAIARITNALEELQNRPNGTALPGIFPQQLDASGCNKSAAAEAALRQKSKAAQEQIRDDDDPRGYSGFTQGSRATSKRDLDSTADATEMQERDAPSKRAPVSAKGLPANWECVPQGLTSVSWGMDSYSMGGSQDSAYEYFPKLFALLGGLEPKYRTMHEKTVAAVKKYLLFRPMAQGDPDILFSAKATSSDNTDQNLRYEWEITHLTCFLGGMFGLGGKLFSSPEDVEIGKRLTDGCVWAYEAMPTGIMPEFAMALPCQKADDCHWNKTAWYEHLDPELSWRDTRLKEYYVKKKEWEAEVSKLKAQEKRRQEVEEEALLEKAQQPTQKAKVEEEEERRLRPVNNTLPGEEEAAKPGGGSDPNIPHDAGKDLRAESQHHHTKRGVTSDIEEKVEKLEAELDLNSEAGHQNSRSWGSENTAQKPVSDVVYPPEPVKPLSHEEVVDQRVKTERLVPGFASIGDRRYILRYAFFLPLFLVL